MSWKDKIADVQRHLIDENIDGWLLFDFLGQNSLAREFLEIDPHHLITRRYFYPMFFNTFLEQRSITSNGKN